MKSGLAAALLFLTALLAMLAVGRCTYQDYGFTIDEFTERCTAGVNYEYVMKTLLGREEDIIDGELETWRDRYYGATLQLPMMAAEALTGFTMPFHEGFRLRHLYTFALCMAGWVCFYAFCRHVFGSRWLALLGMLMAALYPRFWGEQFTNIKDMVFTATCCASLMATALCLEHEGRWRYEALAALVFALCANTRFLGFQFPAFLFGYRVVRDWLLHGVPKGERARWWGRRLTRYAAQPVGTLAVYLLITPAAWIAPAAFLPNVFGMFSNYTRWENQLMFLGKTYFGNTLPWYYGGLWILFTTPLWYLALMAAGMAKPVAQLCARRQSVKALLTGSERYLALCAVVAFLPLIAPLFKEVTLYNSWRHLYYVFPCLVVLALFGFRWVLDGLRGKALPRALVIGCAVLLLAGQVGWIAANHPFEKVYFNPVGRRYAELLDRDYWKESDYHQMLTILRNDPETRVTVKADDDLYRTVTYYLPPELSKRVQCLRHGEDDAEYLIELACTETENRYEGYTPVHKLRMRDGLLLSTVHLRNDVLAERFGGVYPEP